MRPTRVPTLVSLSAFPFTRVHEQMKSAGYGLDRARIWKQETEPRPPLLSALLL